MFFLSLHITPLPAGEGSGVGLGGVRTRAGGRAFCFYFTSAFCPARMLRDRQFPQL